MTDSVLGVVAEDVTLAPGDTQTFTADGPITGTVTNTVTADGRPRRPRRHRGQRDRRRGDRHRRGLHITVTKTAAASDVCDGASVTYTYTVTNDSASFTWTGDPGRHVLGTVADDVTIGAGETAATPRRG